MGHTLRGAMTAWLGLVALGAVVTHTQANGKGGTVTGLVDTVDSLVKRAFDPSVPAIPDRSAGAPVPPTGIGGTVGAAAARAAQAGRQVTTGNPYNPSSRLTGPR